ncbi:hypothetical protein WSM22_14270 [Cytophagales bacterium WSM2-2]|nr:hypothetical protein WSM22_14270 [Cytophagales bacterium WSM2-2]
MLVASENYKGIKFVRISSLPVEQKNLIWKSVNTNLVIKILKDDTLLNDCLQYNHYATWYENFFKTTLRPESVQIEHAADSFKIAS